MLRWVCSWSIHREESDFDDWFCNFPFIHKVQEIVVFEHLVAGCDWVRSAIRSLKIFVVFYYWQMKMCSMFFEWKVSRPLLAQHFLAELKYEQTQEQSPCGEIWRRRKTLWQTQTSSMLTCQWQEQSFLAINNLTGVRSINLLFRLSRPLIFSQLGDVHSTAKKN